MTQPWWPGSGESPPPVPASQAAPWMPPQQGQQGHQPAHQASPWAPPPTPQGAGVPAGQPDTVVNTVEGPGDGMRLHQPEPQPTVPGLGFVTFLLVLGTLAFAAFIAPEGVVAWGTSVSGCVDGGGGWDCLVNDAWRMQVLLPAVAVLGSLSLARGAGVERRQGRAIGWLYVLLGIGLIGFAWTMGASA